MHWDLRKEESSYHMCSQLSKQFQKVKHKSSPLIRALASTTKWLFFRALLCSLLSGVLQYANPLLIGYIIDYVQQDDRDIKTEALLVSGVVVAKMLVTLFSSRSNMLYIILDIKTSNAVNGLVYEKILKFSLIRSVDHSQGSLVNHIQVDSDTLYELGIATGGSMTMPLLIAIGLCFMYIAVGISFLAGVGVLLIMTLINYVINKKYLKVQEKMMHKKDERMKITTEVLNGIKYVRLGGSISRKDREGS